MRKPLIVLGLALISLALALAGVAVATDGNGEASVGGTILAPKDTFNPAGPLLYAVGGSAEEPNVGHISITYRTLGTTCQFDPGA